jgi:hypothetical protein
MTTQENPPLQRLADEAALVWGIGLALWLQYSTFGRFLATKRTWVTVVIGVGVDLLILLLVFPAAIVWRIFRTIALSSIGLIARSLYNEWSDHDDSYEYPRRRR